MPVSSDKLNALALRFTQLGIHEQDIEEKFVRSSGPGGQNVNKTSTAVYLKHLPTGIEVKAQQERSQALNRFQARRLLADRVEEKITGAVAKEKQRVEKIRRQKRKRSKRAKEKMLADKHHQSEKKTYRKTIQSKDT